MGVRFEQGERRVKYTGHLICWVLAGVCLGLLGYDRFIDAFAEMTANYFNRGRGVQVTDGDQTVEESQELVWLLVALMFLFGT